MIFQKLIHLSLRVSEEGRAKAFSRRKIQQPYIRAFCADDGQSSESHCAFLCMEIHRDTSLCQLHRNDPGLLRTPIGLHPRGYMTPRERINMTPNIEEHKYKQTHVPVDIIYKFPGKLQTMQEIHLYSQLTHLADWLVHSPLQVPDPLLSS